MGTLSRESARSKVSAYIWEIESFKKNMRNNLEDMGLKNNDKRDDIEVLIEELECRCNDVIRTLESVWFE